MSRTAIVTGASRGIGRGIATVLAREGYDLCISYRSEAGEAQAVQEELEAACGVCSLPGGRSSCWGTWTCW